MCVCVLKDFIPLSLLTGVLLTTDTIRHSYELLVVSVITYTHTPRVRIKQQGDYVQVYAHPRTHTHTREV